jgi:hypothetical protein
MLPRGIPRRALTPPSSRAPEGARYLAENESRLSWILGSSRSGSTWLLRMLTSLESVVGIDDPHLGHHLGVWRPLPLAWAAGAGRPELTTLDEVKRDQHDYLFADRYRDVWVPALADLVRARFGAQLDEAAVDEPTLVVKEPGSQSAGLLFEAFPRSRLIFLLRDGRDVIDSWLDAYQDGSWAIAGGAFPVAEEGRLALVEWLSSVWALRTRVVSEAFARRPADARILVRYEHLLADPARELGRICETLELEADQPELTAIAEQHAFERVAPSRRGAKHEIRAADPGGWRERLTPAEQRVMHETLGAELAAWGYAAGATVAA